MSTSWCPAAAADEKQSARASDREMTRRVAAGVSAKAGLSVRDLAVQYGGVRAVDGVSLPRRWRASPG